MTNVLILSHALIPSVRLCGYEQFRYLENQGRVVCRFASCEEMTPALGGWADLILMIRSDSKAERLCAKAWRKAGKHLIYVLDDDLLNIPDGFSSSAYYRQKSIQKNIRSIMAECDDFLSPSAHLREKYGKSFAKVYSIEEPALFHTEPREKKPDEPVRIGFAGSVDRSSDLENLLGETVRALLEKYGDRITVELFGAKPDFCDALGLRHIPYTESYDDYKKTMQTLSWDIGLAPMPDTEFHRGKHYNKFVEYSAAGIVGVYSDLLPYKGAVVNGETGLLCPNDPSAFFDAFCNLIDHPKLLQKMKKNVYRLATEDFSIPVCAEELENQLGYLLKSETDRRPIRSMWRISILHTMERIKIGIRQRGFFAWIAHAIKKTVKSV